MKKEFFILLFIFIILTFSMHYKEFLSDPIMHITSLPNSSAYGLGFMHPFAFTFLVYILIWIPRGVFFIFRKKD